MRRRRERRDAVERRLQVAFLRRNRVLTQREVAERLGLSERTVRRHERAFFRPHNEETA